MPGGGSQQPPPSGSQQPPSGPQQPPPPASFVSKPARGWLHPDHLFAKDGINYAVRYIGHLDVTTSMKILDFDTRSAIAKESISRVCEESQDQPQHQILERRRRVERKITSILGERVVLARSGSNVQLTITSLCLRLSDLDSGTVLLQHEMPMISFASGGDYDRLDYIAYVAKDSMGARGCYVLECGGGLAQDVITTIGQAFELRFKEFLKKTPGPRPPPLPALRQAPLPLPLVPDDPEYYNDLPGKAPPSSNLIDFNTEIADKPEYVNSDVQDQRPTSVTSASGRPRDPFDMSPFALNPPGGGIPAVPTASTANIPSPVSPTPAPTASIRTALGREEWYHGAINRKDAETLLKQDGDFLVRESQGSLGQYVLTGMQGNTRKHLLLVDPEGVVRTRDRTFQSVSHLIDYHRNNALPIISAESALRLQRPVVKPRH